VSACRFTDILTSTPALTLRSLSGIAARFRFDRSREAALETRDAPIQLAIELLRLVTREYNAISWQRVPCSAMTTRGAPIQIEIEWLRLGDARLPKGSGQRVPCSAVTTRDAPIQLEIELLWLVNGYVDGAEGLRGGGKQMFTPAVKLRDDPE